MLITRRTLLSSSLALSALSASERVFALPATDTRLLIVFLRGAYDAANVIVPTGSDFYYQSRPTIAIPKPDATNPKAALTLDIDWSLHPALAESLYPLWQKKQLAFIPFAGTDDLSRSHFETQDTIELGQPIGGSRNFRSGFMGRLATALGTSHPMAFSNNVPVIFRGAAHPVPNLAINAVGKPNFDARQQSIIESMYAGPSAQSIKQGFDARASAFKSLQDEMNEAGRGAVNAKGFELQARRIATLMRDQYNLAFLDVGGWDTHVNQGGSDGQLATKIGDLGRGLAAFAQESGPNWNKSVVVVVSEFGRTFRENGNRGTDHGHGSVYWVLGGGVNGGRMVGPQEPLTAERLNQGRDLPVLTDYRALLAGLLARLYGLDAARLNAVFPGTRAAELALI